MTVDEYLAGAETNRPQELAYGILREPPAPDFYHQTVVGRLFLRLSQHVRNHELGQVVVAPIDVILDPAEALVVQPDLLFVSTARLGICGSRVNGAPDLVIEVLSVSNRRHDRSVKVGWYRRYGVRECWVVDPTPRTIEVVDMATPGARPRLFGGDDRILSGVLPDVPLTAHDAFVD